MSRRNLIVAILVLGLAVTVLVLRLNRSPSETAWKVPPPLDINLGASARTLSGVSRTHRFNTGVSQAELENLPKWDRTTDNPPVSVHAAMIAAQRYRDTLVRNGQFPEGSQLVSARLEPIDSQNHLWYWVVAFKLFQGGNEIEDIDIVVLMDGSIERPHISPRLEIGWPPPDQIIAPHESGLSDIEVTEQFIRNLNVDRRFAGQSVRLTGQLERLAADDPWRASGLYHSFVTTEGQKLLYRCPHAEPRRPYLAKLTIEGTLLGFRDLSDETESWDNLTLFPGIQPTAFGSAD